MSDRRPLRFWQPFNDWWRGELERLGRRPNAGEIVTWYHTHAYELWEEGAPSIQETRVHAKCLRSLPLVRDYFRSYRAKKKGGGQMSGSMDDDDEGLDGMDTAQGQDWTPKQSKRSRRITQPRQFNSDLDQSGYEGSDNDNPDQAVPVKYEFQDTDAQRDDTGVTTQAQLAVFAQQQEAVQRYLQLQQQQSAQYQQQLALAALAQQFAATKAAKGQQQGKGPRTSTGHHAADAMPAAPQHSQQTVATNQPYCSNPDDAAPRAEQRSTAPTVQPKQERHEGMTGPVPGHMQAWQQQQQPGMFKSENPFMSGTASTGGTRPRSGRASQGGSAPAAGNGPALPIMPGSDSYEQLRLELGVQQQHLPVDERHELEGLSRGQLVELVIKLQQNKGTSCAGNAVSQGGHAGCGSPGKQPAMMMVLPEMMLGQGHAGLQQQHMSSY